MLKVKTFLTHFYNEETQYGSNFQFLLICLVHFQIESNFIKKMKRIIFLLSSFLLTHQVSCLTGIYNQNILRLRHGLWL